MLEQTRARTLRYGFDDRNDVRAVEAVLDWPHGTRLKLQLRDKTLDLHSRLFGRPGVHAMLAGLAIGAALGVPVEEVLERLAKVDPMPGRLRPEQLAGGAWLLCDEFKSSLETVEEALDVLAAIPAARRQVVLGEISEPPGSQGPVYRRIGARVAAVADRLVVVGGEPSLQRYSAGVRASGKACEIVWAQTSPREAARLLASDLRPGDVVLIKGRDTQRLARTVLHLRDDDVRCEVPSCPAQAACHDCPMLRRGWEGSTAGYLLPGPIGAERLASQRAVRITPQYLDVIPAGHQAGHHRHRARTSAQTPQRRFALPPSRPGHRSRD